MQPSTVLALPVLAVVVSVVAVVVLCLRKHLHTY